MESLSSGVVALGVYLVSNGLIAAYVAVRKGRSAFEGFAIGCLLGPLGPVTVGVLPTVDRARSDRESAEAMRDMAGGPYRSAGHHRD